MCSRTQPARAGVGESGASPAWLLSLRLGADPPSVQDEDQTKIMSSEAGPLKSPSKSAESAQDRLNLPDPDLRSLRPKVVPPSGLSLSPSCTAMNRPRTYMYDGNPFSCEAEGEEIAYG